MGVCYINLRKDEIVIRPSSAGAGLGTGDHQSAISFCHAVTLAHTTRGNTTQGATFKDYSSSMWRCSNIAPRKGRTGALNACKTNRITIADSSLVLFTGLYFCVFFYPADLHHRRTTAPRHHRITVGLYRYCGLSLTLYINSLLFVTMDVLEGQLICSSQPSELETSAVDLPNSEAKRTDQLLPSASRRSSHSQREECWTEKTG